MRKSINIITNKNANFDDYLTHCKVMGFAEPTIRYYQTNYIKFMNFINKDLFSITTNDIENYILHMRQAGNTNSSIVTRTKALKTILKFYNINVDFPSIKREKTVKCPYSEEEIKLLIAKPNRNSFSQWRNWAIVNTLLATGMRSKSIVNLKISDIDFTNNTIYLRNTKTHKSYYIPLSSTLKQVLKQYLSLYQHKEEDYLFPTMYGEQLATQTLKVNIRDYNLKRGVKKTSTHLYRHTFAINALKQGMPLPYLQEVLGHSNIETTRQYLYITVDDLKQDFDNICPLDKMTRKGIKINKE